MSTCTTRSRRPSALTSPTFPLMLTNLVLFESNSRVFTSPLSSLLFLPVLCTVSFLQKGTIGILLHQFLYSSLIERRAFCFLATWTSWSSSSEDKFSQTRCGCFGPSRTLPHQMQVTPISRFGGETLNELRTIETVTRQETIFRPVPPHHFVIAERVQTNVCAFF